MTGNSPDLKDFKPTLIQEIKSTESWTRDITGKFPDTPYAVKVHLQMMADLLANIIVVLKETGLHGERSPSNELGLGADIHLYITVLSNSIRLAEDSNELAVASAQAQGMLTGLLIGKTISQAQHDTLLAQFETQAQAVQGELEKRAKLNLH